ncbi:capsular polysaccharide biosynthesis protein CapF [Carnobacterium maltaromaticum]|uniref:capsular polysaccharide biosynthesis protein CapF n=1 Tax=Carnobacterium maltaromaticum TaxID=2751 RepID=UPI0039AF1057
MNVLITGAKGFVGKNLVAELINYGCENIYEVDRETELEELNEFTQKCDFVFHLAGVNRPLNDAEFMEGNYEFTDKLLKLLEEHQNKAPILLTSSIQAELDNPYGKSKRAGEDILFSYSEKNKVPVYVYRLDNLFGKWSRPNYNSVVATFCYNIARNIELKIDNPETILSLCYIDDVLKEFIQAFEGRGTNKNTFYYVPVSYKKKLGEISELILSFKESRTNLMIPDMEDTFVKKMYSTYLSYLPVDDFSYDLLMNEDNRGSFTEFIKTKNSGQVSINISKPGITKGNHWHHSKNEKFLVVKGEGIIRFRKIDTDAVTEYRVSGSKLQVVDIPVGYTHSIVNVGIEEMVTVMWVNEIFDKNYPDTYFMEV